MDTKAGKKMLRKGKSTRNSRHKPSVGICFEPLEPRQLLSADLTPVQWSADAGGNDHYYEVVVAEQAVSWDDARADAEVRGGYLATVTSAAENAFPKSMSYIVKEKLQINTPNRRK